MVLLPSFTIGRMILATNYPFYFVIPILSRVGPVVHGGLLFITQPDTVQVGSGHWAVGIGPWILFFVIFLFGVLLGLRIISFLRLVQEDVTIGPRG